MAFELPDCGYLLRADPVEEGLCYAPTIGINHDSAGHINTVKPGHPESPARITAILDRLKSEGLLERCQVIEKHHDVDESDLSVVHSAQLIDDVMAISSKDQQDIDTWAAAFDSVFATPESQSAALSSAACTATLTEWIVKGKIPCGIALVRPPGHHCDGETPCGFCLFNNIALAAEMAKLHGAQRVLIVDFDVHHGQGTQRMFYEDGNVLFISIHRHEHGGFWPNLAESGNSFIGNGGGRYANVNIPLQEIGCGDGDYLHALFSLILPVARDFRPDIVLVSAGFDSIRGDPLGRMELTPTAYAHLIHHLKSLADGKVLVVLEGGYNHAMSAVAAAECVRVLMGETPPLLAPITPAKESTRISVADTIAHLLPRYPSLAVHNTEEFRKLHPSPSSTLFTPPPFDVPTGDILQKELLRPEEEERRPPPSSRRVLVTHGGPVHDAHLPPAARDSNEDPGRLHTIVESSQHKDLDAAISAVHEKGYLDWLKDTAQEPCARFLDPSVDPVLDGGSFVTGGTWEAARQAVSATLEAVEAVALGRCPSSFAIVRPPGHHARPASAGGFCFLNNIAIGAKFALSHLGVRRVLIVDVDVHMGDGTLECIGNDENILLVSLHRSDCNSFYPTHADHAEGGRHILIPWTDGHLGDPEYAVAFDQLVLPIAYSFAPDLVLVSAGFDALKGDPLGEYQVSATCLATAVHGLSAVAPLVAVMEGGYKPEVLAEGVASMVNTLAERRVKGSEARSSPPPRPNPTALNTIRSVRAKIAGSFGLLGKN